MTGWSLWLHSDAIIPSKKIWLRWRRIAGGADPFRGEVGKEAEHGTGHSWQRRWEGLNAFVCRKWCICWNNEIVHFLSCSHRSHIKCRSSGSFNALYYSKAWPNSIFPVTVVLLVELSKSLSSTLLFWTFIRLAPDVDTGDFNSFSLRLFFQISPFAREHVPGWLATNFA